MPSPIHTTIVDLLEAHPEGLSYLLGLQGTAPEGPLLPTTATTSTTATIERRVDGAFLLGSPKNPSGFVLAEAQMRPDADKLFSWALYVELARSRYGCEGALVVLTVDVRVRRWIERHVVRRTGQLGSWRQLRPLVIALDEIAPSLLLRPEMPHLAQLAVAAHARSPDAEEIATKAVDLTKAVLPEPLANGQLDAILAMVDAGLRATLEERIMKKGEFRSPFFRQLWAEAKAQADAVAKAEARAEVKAEVRAEARAQVEVEVKAKTLLEILELRGIPPSDKLRARILRCADVAVLHQWLERALVATSAAAVVSGKALSKVAPQPETRSPSGGRSPARSTRSTGGKRAETAKQPA